MKLLLDTHTLLWFVAGNAQLSVTARNLIEDAAHEKYVSVASVWEIAIKISIGKITLAAPFDVLFPNQLEINGFELLPITIKHASAMTIFAFLSPRPVRPHFNCAGNRRKYEFGRH